MNTITAKELRDNLGSIAKRVEAGEQIHVSYRNKLAFKLEPLTNDTKPSRKPMAGINELLQAPRKIPYYDKEKSVKQIYHELLEEKYRAK